ncbi:hypothetical protein [Vitiosangium sp. GDMCC 1.1324]|uniref:hypothetical protein n=1 Tax=Vitiosangium sp. (strain GDMCC 1.1324) TaxID=2138576 RepID=UPI000D366B1E|nr:hypothetical protein [Vitiosangium sp. GDMCC 1.1324]PTL79011.1 hypothetical protein DAT35_35925 [Vitiosangium sp. GDMCC 1.1324]
MASRIDGPSKSVKSLENKQVERKTEQKVEVSKFEKKTGPTTLQKQLRQDGFDTSVTKAGNSKLSGNTVQAFQQTRGIVPQGATKGTQSPEVKAAIDEINKFTPETQAYGLSLALADHGSNSPEDIKFRQELMQALGPDRVAEMMKNVRERGDGASLAQSILPAAAEAFPPADLGKVAEAVGPETLGKSLSNAVRAASDPRASDETRASAESMAKLMGTLYSLPAGSPGKAAVTQAMDRIQGGQQETEAPGVSTAAWLVARSGNDQMKTDFANKYIDEFKKDPSSLSPEEARAVAWVLGSVNNAATGGIEPIVNLDDAQRTEFLSKLTTSEYLETPDLDAGYKFQQDVQAGVNEFLMDVARLNPANFQNSENAKNFRVETFQAVSKAVDGEFFSDSPGTHAALANMFAADTEYIVGESANTGSPRYDREAQAMSKFFDHVAFQDESTRGIVTGALQKYLGVGNEQGIVDQLAAHKGDTAFMQNGGNELARNMGFVLGALYQGSQSAMDSIGDEYAQKRAVVDVLGSLVETAIDKSPASSAYDLIKSGSGDRASVDTVFNWLADQFIGNGDKEKGDVKKLSGAVIEGAWDPFFSDESLKGADPQELTAMFGLINAGVARADGREGQPNINIGGAFID